MRLNILRANPAGNITIFVLDEVAKEHRAEVANKLMAIKELEAEQVGFITEPKHPECSCRLEMMGGEFCGNASRALGLYLAKKQGKSEKMLIEVSGSDCPIEVNADIEAGIASAAMPLPKKIEPFIFSGIECTRVDLEGISHLIAEVGVPDRRAVMAAENLFGDDDEIAAYGIMFFEKYGMEMIPFVKVKATDSLVREGSCGSGTVAAAASLCMGAIEGEFSYTIAQPSGSITAKVVKKDKKFVSVSIGGSVSLGEPTEVEI